MRFTADYIAAFRQLSGDANPLHLDATYAARTSFGRPVVYGVLQTLLALATWSRGRETELERIRCTFHKPVFADADYELVVRQTPHRVVLRWCAGGVVCSDIVATERRRSNGGSTDARGERFLPRTEPRDDGRPPPPSLEYDIDGTDALARLGLASGELPYDQIRTLAGLSYLVGMETPGRQALFATLDVTFPEAAATAEGPFFRDITAKHDDRYGRTAVNGRTAHGSKFELGAFVRPRPTDATIEHIAGHMNAQELREAFAGRRVLVTGASRGFGAALAKAFVIAGARVLVHYRAQRSAAAAVVAEAERYGSASAVEADLDSMEGPARLATAALQALDGAPDILVLNATPPIDRARVDQLQPSTLAAFVGSSLALAHGPCRELLPRMKPGAVVLLVSSIYVREQPTGFGHYVAAKAALEALVAVMAKEHPDLRFVVARLPRMLTDQTNTVGADREVLASPGTVAARLLEALERRTG